MWKTVNALMQKILHSHLIQLKSARLLKIVEFSFYPGFGIHKIFWDTITLAG